MKLVILDRDGVINQDSDNFIKTVEEWIPLPGSLEAISLLNKQGFKIAIATNQSGIARGFYSEDTLHQMHEKMTNLLKPFNGWVDAIFYCPHGPNDNCFCRKPKPGLYHQISKHFNAPLNGVNVVGDSYRDLEAALSVNANPILVRTGKGLKTEEIDATKIKNNNIPIFNDLKSTIDYILTKSDNNA